MFSLVLVGRFNAITGLFEAVVAFWDASFLTPIKVL
jgi:hypothetical protein